MEETKNSVTDETFSISRGTINVVVTGLVFMIAGVFLGLALAGQGLTDTEVRNIVRDEFAIAIESNLSDTLVSVLSAAPATGGLSAEDVRTIMQEEIAAANLATAPTGEAVAGGSTQEEAPQIDAETIEAIVSNALANAEQTRLYRTDDDPSIGPEDAPVVIVEFSDFLCGYCGRHYQQTLTPLLENFDGYVRYVYRDFPGVGGQNAVQSGLAAECADDQGKFWEYHNVLFNSQSALGTSDMAALDAVLIGFAEDLELDMDSFTPCYEDQVHYSDIVLDSGDAQAIGARGTPGFLINGNFISGAQPYEFFEQMILNELRKQGIEYEPPA